MYGVCICVWLLPFVGFDFVFLLSAAPTYYAISDLHYDPGRYELE